MVGEREGRSGGGTFDFILSEKRYIRSRRSYHFRLSTHRGNILLLHTSPQAPTPLLFLLCSEFELGETLTMDSSHQPPVRIIPASSTKLSPTQALDALDEFMADFQERSSPLKGGDNTVTVQLQKLSAALQQEEEANRS